MVKNKYDIVVIGAGHNGLTAAILLAKSGFKVMIAEKSHAPGGLIRSEEFAPGFRTGILHDTSQVRPEIVKMLDLDKFGLKWSNRSEPYTILGKSGEQVTLTGDVELDKKEISKYSENDAAAYVVYRAFIIKIRPFVTKLMNDMPPDLHDLSNKDIWEIAKTGLGLRKLGKKTMMELLKVAPMSVADFLNERFETDFLKAGIAAPALEGSFTGPWSSYTTLNLLIWECIAQTHLHGGTGALLEALLQSATHYGVEIRTNSAVDEIMLDQDQRVTGVKLGEEIIETSRVAASCSPHETFLKLIKPNHVEYSLEHGITHFRARGTTAKLNISLKNPVKILGVDLASSRFRTGNSFDEMEQAFDAVKYGTFSDEPVLDVLVLDGDQVPEGKSGLSVMIHFAPHDLRAGWNDKTRKALEDNVLKTLGQYIEDLEKSIDQTDLLTPQDLEDKYNLPNGHIYHGEHAVDQLLTRPIPRCMQFSTAYEGLYLCGSGSHPGGGITCAPGMLAAKKILKDK